MAEQATTSEKTKRATLSLAEEAVLHIVNVVTNNKPPINEAFRVAEEQQHQSLAREQQIKSLKDQEKEEEYHDLSDTSIAVS